jgi:hypothetical protein
LQHVGIAFTEGFASVELKLRCAPSGRLIRRASMAGASSLVPSDGVAGGPAKVSSQQRRQAGEAVVQGRKDRLNRGHDGLGRAID